MSSLKHVMHYNHCNDICPYMLYTGKGFCNTVHFDCNGMKEEESDQVVKYMKENPEIFKGYEDHLTILLGKSVLPLSTTCCWMFKEEACEFDHQQFFTVLCISLHLV